jgi:hypothetical protein
LFTLTLAGQADGRGLVVGDRDGEGTGGGAAACCHLKGIGGHAHREAGTAGQACGLACGCTGAVVRADGGGVADGCAALAGVIVHADVCRAADGWGLIVGDRDREGAGGSAAHGCDHEGVGGHAHGEAGAAGEACGLAGGCTGAVVRADWGGVADGCAALAGVIVDADVGGAADGWGLVVGDRDGEGAGGGAADGCHLKGVGGHTHGEARAAGQACGLAGGGTGAVVRADWGGVADGALHWPGSLLTLMLAGQADGWGLVVGDRDGEGAVGGAADCCHHEGVGGHAHGEAGAAGQACGLAGGCAGAVVRTDRGRVADRCAHWPGSLLTLMLAGQLMAGASLSDHRDGEGAGGGAADCCHHEGVGGHAHGEAAPLARPAVWLVEAPGQLSVPTGAA